MEVQWYQPRYRVLQVKSKKSSDSHQSLRGSIAHLLRSIFYSPGVFFRCSSFPIICWSAYFSPQLEFLCIYTHIFIVCYWICFTVERNSSFNFSEDILHALLAIPVFYVIFLKWLYKIIQNCVRKEFILFIHVFNFSFSHDHSGCFENDDYILFRLLIGICVVGIFFLSANFVRIIVLFLCELLNSIFVRMIRDVVRKNAFLDIF